MKRILYFVFLSLLCFKAQSIVFGEDDRKELYQVTNPRYRQWASSVAAMIPIKQFSNNFFNLNEGLLILSGDNTHTFCSKNKVYNQTSYSKCSGLLITSNILVTAAHCVDQIKCFEQAWLFDYSLVRDPDTNVLSFQFVDKNNLYFCDRILKQSSTNVYDYALVKLNKRVQHRTPLPLRTHGKIDVRQRVVVIGHHYGQPMKIDDNGIVISFSRHNISVATDAAIGSSGSPIINADTGVVEGILRSSPTIEYSYDQNKMCYVEPVCSENGCLDLPYNKSPPVAAYAQLTTSIPLFPLPFLE